MKNKLNIVGYIAGLLVFTTVVMKINHFTGGGIAMVLAGVAMSIYFPFYLLYKNGEESNAGTNRVAIIGAVCASTINLAITFKFQHWPGAGVLMVLGLVCFALVFVPMLLNRTLKNQGSERKTLMNTLGATGLTLFSLGILFKLMHWPGAAVMLTLSIFFLFFGYFLMYLLDRSINPVEKTAYLRKAFLSVIIGCLVTSLMMAVIHKPYIPASPEEVAVMDDRTVDAVKLVP